MKEGRQQRKGDIKDTKERKEQKEQTNKEIEGAGGKRARFPHISSAPEAICGRAETTYVRVPGQGWCLREYLGSVLRNQGIIGTQKWPLPGLPFSPGGGRKQGRLIQKIQAVGKRS